MPTSPPGLSATAEFYRQAYHARYRLDTKPADSPKAAAEALLRRYQPGAEPRIFETSYVYDRSGVRLAELFDEGRRTWVPLARISPHLIDAVVATEDASFYSNPGIDGRRAVGALLQNVRSRSIVSGASTITMQLARALFFSPEERFTPSLDRKAYEVLLAEDLTDLFTKDEILEMYLNLVYFGHLAYGPEAAARTYFGKSAAELTLGEATLLAGIPQQPAGYDLFLDFAAAKARQRIVLDLMVRHGRLTRSEADAAYAQPITLAPDPNLEPRLAPHFVDYVTAVMNRQLQGADMRRAGLRVVTTLDLSLQTLAETTVAKSVSELKPRYNLGNASLVALKPGTAEILALVGSADYYDETIGGQVNVALSPRQPGSAVKPILYAAAFDQNLVSPATILWDIPIEYRTNDYQIYRPRNYDGRFHGPVTVRTALANSYNVPAVKLLDWVGIDQMVRTAQSMGVSSWQPEGDYGLGLTLGSNEVTLLELAAAYHTLANAGRYLPPQSVRHAIDTEGTVVFQADLQAEQVISPAAAFLVTDVLSDNEARVPAFGRNSSLYLSRPAAAKTGTSTNWRDNWTIGYTRYLVAGVWAGNSDGRPMRNATGITGAAPIWRTFMEAVMADEGFRSLLDAPDEAAAWSFEPPASVALRAAPCPPGLGCRQGGEYFSADWRRATLETGPAADSVVDGPVAEVYVNRGRGDEQLGFCTPSPLAEEKLASVGGALPSASSSSVPRDRERMTYVLPMRGEPLPVLSPAGRVTVEERPAGLRQTIQPVLPAPTAPAGHLRSAADLVPKGARQEQATVISYARRAGLALNLGVCDSMPAVAEALYGEDVRSVTIRRLTVAETIETQPQEGSAEGQPALPVGEGSFRLVSLAQTADGCPGNYIVGRILNRQRGPIAGVRVVAVDEWGNRMEAVSKSGASDYGFFDFPLQTGSPRTYTVTVLDGAGNPISAPIPVQHQQGDAAGKGCSFLVLEQR